MTGIEVIVLEQFLKHSLGHGLDVKIVPNTLPPCKCGANKSMGSEWDIKLIRWCTNKEESVLDRFDIVIYNKVALKTMKL